MSITTVGVVGAGTMGNGIAQVCATAGLSVTMVDVSDTALKRGMEAIGRNLERLVAKDKLSAAARDAALARITPSLDTAAFAGAGLVVEAATENLELKLKILRQIAAQVGPDAVIATNTTFSRAGVEHLRQQFGWERIYHAPIMPQTWLRRR